MQGLDSEKDQGTKGDDSIERDQELGQDGEGDKDDGCAAARGFGKRMGEG